MKQIFKFLIVLPLVALLSCVGKHGEEPGGQKYFVKLASDKKQINIDKAEKSVFSVTADGKDVTANSYIVNVTDGGYQILKNNDGSNAYEFEPLKPGTHSFIAVYDEENSSEIENVRAITVSSSSKFYRRNCVMKFTGTWCTYCPAMGDAIKDVAKKRPDRLVEISVHNSDPLTVNIGNKINAFAETKALPEVMVDYRKETNVTTRIPNAIMREMDASNEANPVVAGIKMDVKQEGDKLVIETETMVTRDGEYKIAVAILADGFSYQQTGTSDPNYRQNSVLMAYLSDNIWGEDLGKMVAQERKPMNFTYDLPKENMIDITRYRVAVMVLNKTATGDFRVNNINQCSVGQSTDYDYEIEEEDK